MRFVLGLVASAALAACFTKPGRPEDPAPPDGDIAEGWLDGWQFRKRVEVHPEIAGTLVDFPIAIVRTDPDLEAHARSEGRDLVATAADGTSLLSTELVTYNAGKLELWVRLPELADGTAFYLYYGGEDQQPGTRTWEGTFKGVWHLDGNDNAIDSTSLGHDLTAGAPATTPVGVADGLFGRARMLDGNDTLDGGDPPSGALDFGRMSFSYSLWVFQTTVLGLYDVPFYKGGGSPNEPGYCWLLGSDNWAAKLHDGNTAVAPELGAPSNFAGRWVHLAAVVDRATETMTVYSEGAARASMSLAGVDALSTGQPLVLGRGTTEPFEGMIDEVRIYEIALEPDWIRAEHANGTDPDFLDVKPEEPRP